MCVHPVRRVSLNVTAGVAGKHNSVDRGLSQTLWARLSAAHKDDRWPCPTQIWPPHPPHGTGRPAQTWPPRLQLAGGRRPLVRMLAAPRTKMAAACVRPPGGPETAVAGHAPCVPRTGMAAAFTRVTLTLGFRS